MNRSPVLILVLVTAVGLLLISDSVGIRALQATPVGHSATPAAATGPAADVTETTLLQTTLPALPSAPAVVGLARWTLAPGSRRIEPPLPGLRLLVIESGVLTVRVEGPAMLVRADTLGTPTANEGTLPATDFTLGTGDQLVVPEGTAHSVGNEGSAPAVFLGAVILQATLGQVDLAVPTVQGVIFEVLGVGQVTALPTGATEVRLVRRTYAPGAGIPNHPYPGPAIRVVESGTIGFEVVHGDVQIKRVAQASAGQASTPVVGDRVSPFTTTILATGEVTFIEAEAVLSVFNAGSDPASTLLLTVFPDPLAQFGTAATPSGGTPAATTS